MKVAFGRIMIKFSQLSHGDLLGDSARSSHLPFPSLLENADCDIGTHVYHDKASGTGNILRYFLVLLNYFVVILL